MCVVLLYPGRIHRSLYRKCLTDFSSNIHLYLFFFYRWFYFKLKCTLFCYIYIIHTFFFTNTTWVHARLCKLHKRVHSIKFTCCLPMVGDSLRVLRLHPPLKTGRHDITEILLKVALKHQKSKNQTWFFLDLYSTISINQVGMRDRIFLIDWFT